MEKTKALGLKNDMVDQLNHNIKKLNITCQKDKIAYKKKKSSLEEQIKGLKQKKEDCVDCVNRKLKVNNTKVEIDQHGTKYCSMSADGTKTCKVDRS